MIFPIAATGGRLRPRALPGADDQSNWFAGRTSARTQPDLQNTLVIPHDADGKRWAVHSPPGGASRIPGARALLSWSPAIRLFG